MKRSIARAFLLAGLICGSGCAGAMPRAYVGGALSPGMRVAVFPLANYTEQQDASDRIVPLLMVEAARQRNLEMIDSGMIEALLAREPWLLLDRLPPDLIDRFGAELQADAILIGSVLALGYRDADIGAVPEFSLALRLLKIPGGECLWSGTHSRSGDDRESLFGLGRIDNLERLATGVVQELVATLPSAEAP